MRMPSKSQPQSHEGLLLWGWRGGSQAASGACASPRPRQLDSEGSKTKRRWQRETEAQQNACMLEEGPSQNESTVGYRRAGTPNCQAAVARLARTDLIFCSD